MKAWEVRAKGFALREVDPPAPRCGETLVRTRYVGICGSDMQKLLHPNRFVLPDPWRPGHEIVGTDTTGRLVAVDPLVPCGGCSNCWVGDTHLCAALLRIGWNQPGGFAEQVAVPATNLHTIPDGLGLLHAVLADPAAVAVHGVRCNLAKLSARLAVVGAGTIGLLTALYAHVSGHWVTVIHREGTEPDPSTRRAVAAVFRSPSQVAAHSFDAVVDAATGGDAAPLELALHLVRDGGAVVVQNAYQPQVRLPTPLREVFRRYVRLTGSFSYCRRHDQPDFEFALDLLRGHTEQLRRLVVHAGSLSDLRRLLGGGRHSNVRYAVDAGPRRDDESRSGAGTP